MSASSRVWALQPDLALALCLRALGLATINHALLGDYDQDGWFTVKMTTIFLGTLMVCTPQKVSPQYRFDHFKISAITAALLFLTKLYTLFFLRDVLTQSLLLAMYFLVITISANKARERLSLLLSLCLLSASTYLLAIIHKLNFDFLYTAQSCAIHGYEISLSLIPSTLVESSTKIGILKILESWPLVASLTVLGIELSLAILCWRRHKYLWYVGFIFHLPLTLTIAPSFGTVMAIGWGAGTMLGHKVPRHSRVKRNSLKLILKHRILIFLYFTHGLLSPYLGIEVQHSAAMLSNLRVDPVCANSMIFPKLNYDPYLHIDEARFGQVSRPKRIQKLKHGLWNFSALNTMQKNWCIKEQRPLYMQGHYLGQSFSIDDLCKPDALDKLQQLSNIPVLNSWQRFQKNLKKRCHQACLH